MREKGAKKIYFFAFLHFTQRSDLPCSFLARKKLSADQFLASLSCFNNVSTLQLLGMHLAVGSQIDY